MCFKSIDGSTATQTFCVNHTYNLLHHKLELLLAQRKDLLPGESHWNHLCSVFSLLSVSYPGSMRVELVWMIAHFLVLCNIHMNGACEEDLSWNGSFFGIAYVVFTSWSSGKCLLPLIGMFLLQLTLLYDWSEQWSSLGPEHTGRTCQAGFGCFSAERLGYEVIMWLHAWSGGFLNFSVFVF